MRRAHRLLLLDSALHAGASCERLTSPPLDSSPVISTPCASAAKAQRPTPRLTRSPARLRRLQALVRPRAGSDRGVQRLGRNISSIRPNHGPAIEEETSELVEIPEWLEHAPDEPSPEADCAGGSVVEHEMDPVATTIGGLADEGEESHTRTLLERLDSLKGVAPFHGRPVGLELGPVENSPGRDVALCPPGADRPRQERPVKGEGGLVPTVLGVEVGRIVLFVVHPDEDAKEGRNDGHGLHSVSDVWVRGLTRRFSRGGTSSRQPPSAASACYVASWVQPGYMGDSCPGTWLTLFLTPWGGRVMPWQETDPVRERHHFAQDLESGLWSMTELCLRYGISRNTGYKWLERYGQEGPAGFLDRSRAPRSCPHQTPAAVVALILEEHTRFGWGARKIWRRLHTRDPKRPWPARSTIFDILARAGRVDRRRRRRPWKHPGAAPLQTTAPNQIWTIDFKGQFRMRNGVDCFPLTVIDHFSRYLLCCRGLLDVAGAGVRPQLRQLFRTYGLPEAIRSDNGAPFASTGIHGLNRLNVWWLQLGISHQRITPGSPQENGAHERLHKTLKAQVARPPAANLHLQQRVFNRFHVTYNDLRPHEALEDNTPASRWTPSPRPFAERIAPPEYPGHFEVRRVSNAGTFRLHSGQQFLSQALNGEYIGLEEVHDRIWNIVYYHTLLGRFHEETRTITGAPSLKENC